MMTEEQARQTQCCGGQGSGHWEGNRRLCVASKCMAWRTMMFSRPNRYDASSHEVEGGYCGLAGKP